MPFNSCVMLNYISEHSFKSAKWDLKQKLQTKLCLSCVNIRPNCRALLHEFFCEVNSYQSKVITTLPRRPKPKSPGCAKEILSPEPLLSCTSWAVTAQAVTWMENVGLSCSSEQVRCAPSIPPRLYQHLQNSLLGKSTATSLINSLQLPVRRSVRRDTEKTDGKQPWCVTCTGIICSCVIPDR